MTVIFTRYLYDESSVSRSLVSALLKQNEETDIQTTYKLMKQDEEINNNYNNFWKTMKTIKHNK